MLAFLPIIGPIIQGIVSIFTKAMDTKVAVLKTERTGDLGEAQVSEQIIHDTQDDIGLRLMRDLLCFPTVVWACLIGWDTIIADPKQSVIPHSWMFHVANYPDTVGYLPYAVVVFLLGNIGLNIWKRK
jgi:hypothetical protein